MTAIPPDLITVARDLEGLRGEFAALRTLLIGDPWHYIGATGEPPFENPWTNFAGGYRTARFRKEGNRVFVESVVKSGANASVVFTLPEGYRPTLQVQVWSRGSDGGAETLTYLNVATSGAVQVALVTASGAIDVVSMSFTFGLGD